MVELVITHDDVNSESLGGLKNLEIKLNETSCDENLYHGMLQEAFPGSAFYTELGLVGKFLNLDIVA